MARNDTSRSTPVWSFPEYTPVGTDLGSVAAVAAYDRNQGTNSEYADALLTRLGVTEGSTLVDLGCGTGSLVVQAARRGALAHGVDVSEEMLAFAERRAAEFGVTPEWHHAGFLDYQHPGPPADVIVSEFALHQLPDFWKLHALRNIASMLRPGGRFYLSDVIYSFEPEDMETELGHWIKVSGRPEGEGFTRENFESHVRDEFSTYSWIIEGLLERAGFEILLGNWMGPCYGEYLCTRK
jgi:cyclopropane fatty-acyl-phospholipid synthase-like methyltransferase